MYILFGFTHCFIVFISRHDKMRSLFRWRFLVRIIKQYTLYIVSVCLFWLCCSSSFAFHPALEETKEVERELNNVFPAWPKVNYGTGSEAKLIKRGEYLAKA